MLGKLLKNEILQTGRLYLWLQGIAIAVSGIGVLITINQQIGIGQFVAGFLWNMLLLVFAAALQLVGPVVVVLIGMRRSLFSEQGYLTFALPVSTAELLLSKFIAGVMFLLVNILEAAGLVYICFSNLRRLFSNISDSLLDQMGMDETMKQTFSQELISLPSFTQVMRFSVFVLLVVLTILVLVSMGALFVLTVSHVRPFQAKPGLWIMVFLVAVFIVCQQAIKWISKFFVINISLQFGAMGANETIDLNLTVALVMIGLTVMFFFLTNWLMKRKISLK